MLLLHATSQSKLSQLNLKEIECKYGLNTVTAQVSTCLFDLFY